jgi:hypothetical protein
VKTFAKIAPLLALLAACSGKVVIDVPGSGGTAGSGGTTATWSYPTTTYYTTSYYTTSYYGGYGGYYTGGTGGYYTGGTGGTGGSECGGQPYDQCTNCCVQVHAQGYNTYLTSFVNACACAGPTLKCYAACAQDACLNPQNIGNACGNCLNQIQNDQCVNQVQQACSADPDCVSLLDCVQVCQ